MTVSMGAIYKALCISFALSLCLGWTRPACAQPAGPHIGYAFPAGGRQGTTFQVKIGGQFLDGVTNVYVSGSGVKATVKNFHKPLTPQQANALRDKLRELQEKRNAAMRPRRNAAGSGTNATWTAADMRAIDEIRAKLAGFQRRPPNPSIAETVTLQVAIAANAEPGRREIRLGTPQGLSNPLAFCLGQLPEISEAAPVTAEVPPLRRPRDSSDGKAVPASEMSVAIPAVINGQIQQGGVDRYRFRARQGQQLVVTVSARELIPYIADAVPGWFQATLTLRDSKGNELNYSDDFRFRPDPVLFYQVQKDGEYIVEIKDALYRGRDDFIYRIAISESPFLTGIFPLGGQAGAPTEVTLTGWNLPTTNLVVQQDQSPAIYPVAIKKQALASNPLPFALGSLPETLETEPNDSVSTAQALTLPLVLNGRISSAEDRDVFRLEGRAGQDLVAEVWARRLDSPLDSVLRITDASGRQLAFNDDHEDKGSGLNTHHADSYLRTALPSNGVYYVHLGDAQRQGGPEFAYRLRLSQPQPDFDLRLVPATINVRPGMNVPLTVYALRKDGFTNEISLELDEAPSGFGLSGARIPAGADQVRLTLAAPTAPLSEPARITLTGHAFIGGKRVSRQVIPAEDMMQAFAYRHLVPAQELKVAVVGRSPGRASLKLLGAMPVKIPAGGSAKVRLNAPPAALAGRFELELNDAPEGISLGPVRPADFGTEIALKADASKLKPGCKGNLIVTLVPAAGAAQKAKKQPSVRRGTVGVLPAIPFEITTGGTGL